MTGINRRGLLKGSIFGMAAAGASVIPVAVQAQAAAPVKTEEYDVVVIGCGCAGMAAALEAADKGAKVVILEKVSRSGRQHDFWPAVTSTPPTPMSRKRRDFKTRSTISIVT